MSERNGPGYRCCSQPVVAFNPLGLDVFHAAFFANEALTRNIWESIALTGTAIMTAIGVLEWLIRKFIINRRARVTTSTS